MTLSRIAVAAAAALLPLSAAAQHLAHDAADSEASSAVVRPAAPAPGLPSAKEHAELERVRRATARYRDHAAAVRDGYRLFGSESALMGEHWYRSDLLMRPFDPARPAVLQYATVGGRRVLVGVAYTVFRLPGEALPEGFSGPDDHWHAHDVAMLTREADLPLLRATAERRVAGGGGLETGHRLAMVHAWPWLANPDGDFAQRHRALPYLRAGLPAAYARGATVHAARGVALAEPYACAEETRRTRRLARLDAAQERELGAACERAAVRVRRAVARKGAAALNAAAEAAWRAYETAGERLLRDEQKARLDALPEHAPVGEHRGAHGHR